MKKILTLICILLCANVLLAQTFWIGDLQYEVTSSTWPYQVKVNVAANATITTVNIPATVSYDGTTYNVTSIGNNAFNGCSSLTSITIPNSVTSIGEEAFESCNSLTSITIPNSVTSIGVEAFYACWSLTSVTIPNSVTSIGNRVFQYCSSLTSITIPNSVTYIGQSAFKGCSSLTSITIPNSVTSISYRAFEDCSSLTTLNFNAINCSDFNYGSSGFISLPFYGLPITTINIGDSVQRIPAYFAYNLDSLTSITIPNSVTFIGNNAFYDCNNLTSMTVEYTNIPNLSNIGLNSTLQNLTLGENVTSIASGAFNNYSFLQNVTCLATTPPTLADNTVFPYPNIATLTVPCGTLEAYSSPTSFWNMFFMGRISEDGYEVVANVNNDAFGSVAIENNCSTATLTATANACYQFVGWNDGNTENPRLVTLSSDTTLTANFEEIVFDTTITATINAGEMYSEFGFNESEAGTYVQNLQTVNGCDSTITLILDVNSSLMDVEHSELSFYPNPTDSKITFSSTIESIEVIDLTGRCILTFSNAREINIESLPAGAYYLRLTNNEKQTLRKLIKE